MRRGAHGQTETGRTPTETSRAGWSRRRSNYAPRTHPTHV